MSAILSPGVERWRRRFAEDAVAALEAALVGRMSLGQYDRARPSEALSQLLAPADIPRADAALQTWLAERLGQPMPEDLTPKTYADALVEAFRTIQAVPLSATRDWCAAHAPRLRTWLRGFALGSSRDPEAALLVALAYQQRNRNLLFTWYEVIRRGHPVEHVRHALLGLRLMPTDEQGAVERGLPKALLRGLLEYGETLVRAGESSSKPWLGELDFLAAVYPMSKEVWTRRFAEVLQARQVSKGVHNWLDRRYPINLQQGKTAAKSFLKPPHVDDMVPLLLRMSKDFVGTRPALIALLDYHRHYTQESGDSYYLVRGFCRLGDKLLDYDPLWARELAHEAARWAPNDPHTWSLLARALEAEGDWRRAEAVYWHARRRFPHDDQRHNQLGHALLLHGQTALGEQVFRQATRLVPNDPICWSELAHSLRVTGQYEQAVAVYKDAQQAGFHRHPSIANAFSDTLLDLGRLDEAEAALYWAEHIVPDDDKNQRILAQIRQRFNQARNGQLTPPRQLQPLKEITGGELGALADITGTDISHAPLLSKASLGRRQGGDGLTQARHALAALHDGSAKLIEQGLLISAEQSWAAAFDYFDNHKNDYAGDGALQIHRLRALQRSGGSVDWASEKTQYPDLKPVIITEERGRPPSDSFTVADSDLSEDQKQQRWFSGLAGDSPSALRDWVEEDFLTARQVA
ncbi:MAG: tetratricopeptide repeat protein [Methylovulum sp.]|nr:tetratricopeptide repeat protein [Methylovulum sp.]